MSLDNDSFNLQSNFIEVNGFFISDKTHNGKRDLGTVQQAFLLALETNKLNHYPNRIKVMKIKRECREKIKQLFKHIHCDQNTTVYTDGDPSYLLLKDSINLINGIIDYNQDDYL